MPVAKIIILNWNGADHLRRFLPSVVAAAPAGVEVIVADNGSTDDSLAALAAGFPCCTILEFVDGCKSIKHKYETMQFLRIKLIFI